MIDIEKLFVWSNASNLLHAAGSRGVQHPWNSFFFGSGLAAQRTDRIRAASRRSAGLVALMLALAPLVGCGRPVSTEASSTTSTKPAPSAPIDAWVLTTLDPNDPTPALLWNGLIGLRLSRDATTKGQPFFAIDEYDPDGEERIRPLSCPIPNGFVVGGKFLPITGGYRQSLDMRTSELDTQWQSGRWHVDCQTVMHPSLRVIAQRWRLTGGDGKAWDFDMGRYGRLGAANLMTQNVVIPDSGMMSHFIVSRPDPSMNVIDFEISMGRSANAARIAATRGKTLKMPGPWQVPPPLMDFSKVEAETQAAWAKRWQTDIEIDGPVADQQAIHSFLYYLRSAISPMGEMSVSPFGLSNSMYNGHVFWDADIWVFPALMLIDPQEAQAILRYRMLTKPMAGSNYQDWIKAGRPTASHPLGSGEPWKNDSWTGLKYAWESSVSGKETVPGPSRFEDHITGDVWFASDQARALGLAGDSISDTMILARGAAKYYANRIAKRPDGLYDLKSTVSPDENHTGDNDLYTNVLAQNVTDDALWNAPKDQRIKLYLPKDGRSFLTYDNDPLKSYKQAAAVLSIYPLQYPPAEKEARTMMDRFADKVISNGPAMTDSVHALIWARIGDRDKAYQTWKKSWQPFTNQALMLFSEKRNKPTTYFTTGAAGALQTVLFGFMGFRLDSSKVAGAAWSADLQGGSCLSAKPNFPSAWKSVKFKNFMVHGRRLTLTATHSAHGADAIQVIKGD